MGPGERSAQWAATAGPRLVRVAVSAELRTAVSAAVGFAVTPTCRAVYLADPPGSLVAPHIDRPGYDLTVHLVLSHVLPANGPGSALVIHRAFRLQAERLFVAAGEAVVVRARGTVHSWSALAQDEQRSSAAIGFAPA